jgi:hypothetical protein
MGLLDNVLGRRRVAAPAADRLFAITTAYIDLQARSGVRSGGAAAIVFQPLATGDFEQLVSDVEAVVRSTGEETASTVERSTDTFGYHWMIVRDDDVDDLAVGINAVSDELATGGYADRVLCAVFAFADAQGEPLYLIYNYKRGTWYPFAPSAAAAQERDTERELRLRALLGDGLPVEPEVSRWFPLWGIPI